MSVAAHPSTTETPPMLPQHHHAFFQKLDKDKEQSK